jgi:ubiquinone/menaquinone biosynthesis C-methylase UbiE
VVLTSASVAKIVPANFPFKIKPMMPKPQRTDPNKALRDEFNRWAEAGRGEGMEDEHLPIVLPVIDRMELAPDDHILDVGCGTGWLSAMLAERVPEGRVVGMDISDEMVRRARSKYVAVENAMFVIGGVDEIPWDANFFTQTISVESAYYWPDPASGLREMLRVLRDRGSAWILINYYKENVHSHQWAEHFATPTHLLDAEEWEALILDVGFDTVSHRRIPDPSPVPESYSGRWFRDAAQLRAFRKFGALLLHGTK